MGHFTNIFNYNIIMSMLRSYIHLTIILQWKHDAMQHDRLIKIY